MVPGSGNPWQKDAELYVTTGSFDKNSDKQADINIPVNFHRNTLTSITNGNYTLVEGIDYTVTNSSITLSSSYLSTLENGSYTLNFNFSSGNAGSFTVTVTDSTPDTDDTFDLSKLKIRYYYTNEGNVNENIWLDTAAMKFTRAPWYADLTLSFRIAKKDWSQYDQSNDYSYNDGSKILVYYDGEIINSIEP